MSALRLMLAAQGIDVSEYTDGPCVRYTLARQTEPTERLVMVIDHKSATPGDRLAEAIRNLPENQFQEFFS